MSTRAVYAWLVLLVGCTAQLYAQTVEEVIAKNIEKRGGIKKIQSIRSVRYQGTMTLASGIEIPLLMEQKRPRSMRLELIVQGTIGVQVYDGEKGWSLMPFQGQTEPVPMNVDELRNAEEQADMNGPLIDYREKGNRVQLLGKERVKNREAFKIKVTLAGGDLRFVYLDTETYLKIQQESVRTVGGMTQETVTIFADYRQVDGLQIPHVIDTQIKGTANRQLVRISTVTVDPPIDDSRFRRP